MHEYVGDPHFKTASNTISIDRTTASFAIFRSGVFDSSGREWVIAAQYSNDDTFGYFVIKEHGDNGQYVYTDQYRFFQKINEGAYQAALDSLHYISSFQK